MTETTKIELTDANYKMLVGARGATGVKNDDAVVKAIAMCNSLDANSKGDRARIVSSFEDMYQGRVKGDSLEVLTAKGVEVVLKGGKMLALLNDGALWVQQFTTKDDKGAVKSTPRLTFSLVLAEDGKSATVAVNSGTVRASKGGTKSENSRISSFVAYTRGQKAGDDKLFKIEQVKGTNGKVTGYADVTKTRRPIPKKGLTAWLCSQYPGSHAVAILKDYGQAK